MNDENRKICRLCLKVICDGDFDIIEQISRHMFEVLHLNMGLDITKEPVMCSGCAAMLQRSFDFKSFCLNTENTLQSFPPSVENSKLTLMEVYLSKNKKNIADITEDQKICRICIEPVERGDFIDLYETKEDIFVLDILHNKIPEVDLSITEEPVICKTCQQSLQHLYSFIQNCCSVEETINKYIEMNGADDGGQIDLNNLQNANLKSQAHYDDCKDMQLAVLVKTEIENEDNMEVDHLEPTENQEEIECVPEQNNFISLQELSSVTSEHKCNDCAIDLMLHKCHLCTYETHSIRNIRRHMVCHKNPTEVKLHQCTICPFSSKYRPSYNLHILTHKNASELVMAKCPICEFETKYKKNLKRHMMVHKSGARKDAKYECGSCTFKTNNKVDLRVHVLCHRNLEAIKCEKCESETNDENICDCQKQSGKNKNTIHKCTMCAYTTKFKSNLKKHAIRHKKVRKPTLHICEVCSFQSKRKFVVDRHRLIHKRSDIATYKCMICLFETKDKSVLKTHRLTHHNPQSQQRQRKLESTDISVKDKSLDPDIIMFKCDNCSYESKYKADIRKHVLIHMKPSEVTMYKCETCVYETKFKSAFSRHMLVHRDPSEVTVYKCEFCPRRTKYKRKFDKHMLAHYNTPS